MGHLQANQRDGAGRSARASRPPTCCFLSLTTRRRSRSSPTTRPTEGQAESAASARPVAACGTIAGRLVPVAWDAIRGAPTGGVRPPSKAWRSGLLRLAVTPRRAARGEGVGRSVGRWCRPRGARRALRTARPAAFGRRRSEYQAATCASRTGGCGRTTDSRALGNGGRAFRGRTHDLVREPAGCVKFAHPVRRAATGNGATARSEAPASAKAAGNGYPLCLPPPRQSSTLHRQRPRIPVFINL